VLGTLTTLESIIAGDFPTAKDKEGTGSTTVTVQNLQVLYVHTESDGDWHVAVTDGTVPVFITEITPPYEPSLGMPLSGSFIDEIGTPYCDTYHQNEGWHGNTCWEIHPVTFWKLSSESTSVTQTNRTALSSLNVTITYAQNPISRGSYQTITVQAFDSDGPVSNTNVSIVVDYASGLTTKYFACATSSGGSCSVTWLIGGNSTPGTFGVTVQIERQEYYSSFTVTTA
jgi:hypothetical protein